MATRIPYIFATNGDTSTVPDETSTDELSWEDGWSDAYALDSDESGYRYIDRSEMNYLFNVLSANIKEWQEQVFPVYSDEISYPEGAIVLYTDDVFYEATTTTTAASVPGVSDDWVEYTRSGELSALISANTTSIETNATNIATNASDIAENTSDIATNATNIATNASDIAENTSDIATNATNIATNTSDIAENTSDIATNATNIATNTSDIEDLQELGLMAYESTTAVQTISSGSWTDVTDLTYTVANDGTYSIRAKVVSASSASDGDSRFATKIISNSTTDLDITAINLTTDNTKGTLSVNQYDGVFSAGDVIKIQAYSSTDSAYINADTDSTFANNLGQNTSFTVIRIA